MENEIKTRYLTYKDDGRLGNQLYYILQAYINSLPKLHYKYFLRPGQEGTQYYDFFLQLNLGEYVTDSADEYIKIDSWKQEKNFDYTMDQIDDFVENTILKSELYSTIEHNDTDVAIHIRNGDYLHSNNFFTCFNRYEYIIRSLSYFRDIQTIHVFSDQIDIAKQQFGYMFDLNFDNVIYENGSSTDDFVKFSAFKNKILFNSTFSFWAAFIGDAIFKHETNTTVPETFTKITPVSRRSKDNWIII